MEDRLKLYEHRRDQLIKLEETIAKDRKEFYEHLLSKRNWFQKLFNIEPDMSFFDMANHSFRSEMTKTIMANTDPNIHYFG